MIGVVVPLRGEEPPAPEALARLFGDGEVDVVVAPGREASDSLAAAWEAAGARVLRGVGPRGDRLRQGARQASGEVLLFLHADTVLPRGWRPLVEAAIQGGAVGGAFRLGFQGDDPRMRRVAFWANLRTALTRIPYGDQAPFVRRDVYERLGGHAPWPLLEDVDLSRRLRRAGRVKILTAAVATSPRRYLARGVARTVLRNWMILWKFRLGADPRRLAEEYRR